MVTLDYCKRRFNMTEKEYDEFYIWYNYVIKNRKISNYFGAIGGELTFKITPTSLGEIITVEFMDETYIIKDL